MASQNNPKVEELINLDEKGTIWFDNESSQIKKLNKNGNWEILFDPNKTSTKILYNKDKNLVQYWDSSVDNWVTLFNPENKPTKKDIQTHYRRNFRSARGSEQFLNDELHQIHTALKNINYRKNENKGEEPYSVLDGALWFDKVDNQLKYWDEPTKTWKCIFSKKFQITDQITNITTPASPVSGQLWIYNGVLMYFDGQQWRPIKAMIQDETQWSNAAFEDYIIVTPLSTANTASSAISNGSTKHALEQTEIIKSATTAGAKFKTPVYYEIGNGELEVFVNGIKMTNGLRFFEATRRGEKAEEKDYGNISNIFIMNISLEPNDIVAYKISRNTTSNSLIETALEQTLLEEYEDTHKNTNIIESSEIDWLPDNGVGTNIEWPKYITKDIDESLVSQFVVPNINTDRVFIDHNYNNNYNEINKVCIEYRTKDVYNKVMSAIHMNPGKLTKITKRLIKIDRQNPTLEMNAYNTEFYGFKVGQIGGDFLIPSFNQDEGDYVPAGDCVILNEKTSENYDYVLAITFEFAWIKSDGLMEYHSGNNHNTSYYITNLQTPIVVHSEGFMLEEAAYNIDNDTITFDDDIDGIDIDVWSPKYKEYGYIRDIDLEGNGIIHLHHNHTCPIVFVGGILMDPYEMQKNINMETRTIKIPNEIPYIENMKNQPWCVIDIAGMTNNDGKVFSGVSTFSEELSIIFKNEETNDPARTGDYVLSGDIYSTEEQNIYDFVLGKGSFEVIGFTDIIYDNSQIKENDGILLFVNGLLVCPDDIDRDDNNGIINIYNLEEGAEWILLKDPDGRIYNHANMLPAYSVGYISDSLVYLKGKLLANENCVATTMSPEKLGFEGMVHNEIKFFIEDEEKNIGTWKIYDAYLYKWLNLEEEFEEKRIVDNEIVTITSKDVNWVKQVTEICSSYVNLLTTIYINLKDYEEKDLAIYAFKFANTNSGIYKSGSAVWYEDDEEDGYPIYQLDDLYSRGLNNLNLYKNGLKLVNGIHYKELDSPNKIKLLTPTTDFDIIKYIIEPIESGETKAYTQITLTNENSIQPNVYEINNEEDSFYPGRITVYVNGLRLPSTDWTIIDNKKIMLNYNDYKATSSVSKNYPEETYIKDKSSMFTLTHKYPDYIVVEVRKDYDRQEFTFLYKSKDGNQLYLEDKKIPDDILDCKDEILFFLNGQYLGLSRRIDRDYNINKYKACIELFNVETLNTLIKDPMEVLLQDPIIKNAWTKFTNKTDYIKEDKNKITLVWR